MDAACSYLDPNIFRPFPTLGDSGTRYFLGQFDGERFIEEEEPSAFPAFAGPDDYAAIPWNKGGAITALGWMNNWVYAPSDLPTENWKGQMSLPRELRLVEGARGLVLKQNPVASLIALRKNSLIVPPRKIEGGEEIIPEIVGTCYELVVEFEKQDAKAFGLKLRVGAQHHTTVGYEDGRLFLDRSHSGQSNFSQHFARRYSASLPLEEGKLRLHVFVDQSSVEVFAQDGLCYLAALIFPDEEAQQIALFADEGSAMMHSMAWHMLG